MLSKITWFEETQGVAVRQGIPVLYAPTKKKRLKSGSRLTGRRPTKRPIPFERVTLIRVSQPPSPLSVVLPFRILMARPGVILTPCLFSSGAAYAVPVVRKTGTVDAVASLFRQRPKRLGFALLQGPEEKPRLVSPVGGSRTVVVESPSEITGLHIDGRLV